MKTSIVILNWNGRQMLHDYLPSILANSQGAEVIVADNASTDESLSLLRKEFPAVRCIQLDKNYGFAEGYNQALRQVEADYYVLLNSDVEVTPGWLTPMTSYLEAHPEVAACQPKIRSLTRRTHFEYAGACGGFIDKLGYPYCRGRLFDTVEEDKGQYDSICSVMWATGAALFIRSKCYWEAGGLDGSFFAHQEEIDLCWRLHLRGYDIVCIPQSIVYHLGGGTLPKDNPRKTYYNFRNNLLLLHKNLPESRFRQVLFLRFFLDALASLIFLLRGQRKCCLAVWKGWRDARKVSSVPQSSLTNPSLLGKELGGGCILWQYHILHHKTYSQLPCTRQKKRCTLFQ